ncbi:MAG: PAS domain S-box protein [Bacteroidales bacterium]|nr:PAS domain S-box protein [Bacteroidales bacterium]
MSIKRSQELTETCYRIALSIGNSLELISMLKTSLLTYMQQLKCTAAAVYRSEHKDGEIYITNVFSLPYTLNIKEEYAEIIKIIPEKLSYTDMEEFIFKLPVKEEIKKDCFLHAFHLPGFGILALIHEDSKFSDEVMFALSELNSKLARACIACVKNEILEESEIRFRNLNDLLPELVCELDLNGIVTYANNYSLTKLGYTAQDIKKGFSIFNIFLPEDRALAAENFKKALTNDEVKPREYTIVKKNGDHFRESYTPCV